MNRDFRACLPATAMLPFQSALAGGGRGCPDAPWSASAECGAGERCQASAPHDGNAELMKRLADDNGRASLSKDAQAQGKFAADLLSK